MPGGFDVVFDGIGEDGYRRSYAALKRGGLLCAIGFSASVQAQRRMLPIVMEIARLYLWRLLPGGKRARFYSVNVMRARHPTWFKEDLERLFGLLATGAIRPHVAERISFDEVADAHRRLEAGGLEGKLVLCPDLEARHDFPHTALRLASSRRRLSAGRTLPFSRAPRRSECQLEFVRAVTDHDLPPDKAEVSALMNAERDIGGSIDHGSPTR